MTRLSEFFEDFEFHCQCGRRECDAPSVVSSALLKYLTEIRRDFDAPVRVTSGIRCKFWNNKQGGVAISGHLNGSEADIRCDSSRDRYKILSSAYRHGVPRIGIGETFIHIGVAPQLDQQVTWLYRAGRGIMGAFGC